MTIPAGATERKEKLEQAQKRLEAAQAATSRENNPWAHLRAQAIEAAALRRAAALYKGGSQWRPS